MNLDYVITVTLKIVSTLFTEEKWNKLCEFGSPNPTILYMSALLQPRSPKQAAALALFMTADDFKRHMRKDKDNQWELVYSLINLKFKQRVREFGAHLEPMDAVEFHKIIED